MPSIQTACEAKTSPGQRVMIASSRDFIRWSAPQLLAEPSDGDYGTKKILTPGGIRVCDGRLTVYYTENDNDGTSNARLNPQLYAVTSPDGRTWTRPVSLGLAIFPSHAPLRLSTGRLAMTCNRAFYYSDDPTGLRGWHKCGTAAQDQTGHVTFEQIRPSLCEGELFEHADGTLYCLFRNSSTPYDGYLWQAQSYDGGRNWTMPVRSDFSDNNTKSFFCALPDGRYLYIGTPDNTVRAPVIRWCWPSPKTGSITTNATSSPTTATPGNTKDAGKAAITAIRSPTSAKAGFTS